MFSKACEYAIRSTIYIAEQSNLDKRVSITDIAKAIDSPEAFTAKILQMLVKKGIIKSIQGATGGFETDPKNIKKIKLIDIVIAIDGDLNDNACVLGLHKCSEIHPCPVHNKYKHIKKDLLTMLQKTSLDEMSNSVLDGLTCLKN